MKDFKNINFEIIDINVNTAPDIYINKTSMTFTKRVLEDLNYPAFVQYCISPETRVFAIRVCKTNETKAAPFSKPRAEQVTTLSCGNKNVFESVRALINDCNPQSRYRLRGYFDSDSRTMFFDLDEAVEEAFRAAKDE